jgi:hypothetical protein
MSFFKAFFTWLKILVPLFTLNYLKCDVEKLTDFLRVELFYFLFLDILANDLLLKLVYVKYFLLPILNDRKPLFPKLKYKNYDNLLR